MIRVGLYVDAPATDFIEWLEAWASLEHAPAISTDLGRIALGAPRRALLLSQHLVIEISGIPPDGTTAPSVTLVLARFHVIPVGLGSSVEVIGVSDFPELMPYLVAYVAAANERWPEAIRGVWFGEPPAAPVGLCRLRVSVSAAALERRLARFAAAYAEPGISSVSFLPDPDRRSPGGHRHWFFRLSLHTAGDWQGIGTIALPCEIAAPAGKQPAAVTLWRHGFLYKEIEPFAAALIAVCQARWHDTQVSHLASGPGASSAAESHQRRQPHTRVAQQRWTLADRPWEVIADVAWDRLLVELWWQDHPSAAIARRAGVTPKTVINRLSQLRRVYGQDLVPTETQRRGWAREKLGYPG